MQIFTEEFIIKNRYGAPMLTDIRYKQDHIVKPLIVFSHGFKGFKDFAAFSLFANIVAQQNVAFLKFNFSGNGTTPENPTEFIDLDTFAANTFSCEVSDLLDVIDYVTTDSFVTKHMLLPNTIYLIGHSLGGAISILVASKDARITKLVTWASVFSFEHFWNSDVLLKWKKEGIRYELNKRTGQMMPISYQLYVDYCLNKNQLDVPTAIKNITIPFLALHGDKDESVPYEVVNMIHKLNQNVEKQIITNATHTFNTHHPWLDDSLPDEAIVLLEKTVAFLK